MNNYDKDVIREQITDDIVFDLLLNFGADPIQQSWGILSQTICHNPPGEGSRKLYYYNNTGLFKCYSNCGTFDIFELVIKVAKEQWGAVYDLNDAIRYICIRYGLVSSIETNIEDGLEDWKTTFHNYDRVQSLDIKDYHAELKAYDDIILTRLNYNVELLPWLREGISHEAMRHAQIGYYPGGAQITIPHFDINGRFVGLRGRALCQPDIDLYGKYRPVVINRQLYNHPLGMNLYNLNNSKDHIRQVQTAIIFESEKSCLKYQSYFGIDNDISVACCGSNISAYQIQLLLDCGVKSLIIAFDRQFQAIDDDEFKKLTANLTKIYQRYKNYIDISFVFDKNMITGYKDAPIDCGKEIFKQLLKERITL